MIGCDLGKPDTRDDVLAPARSDNLFIIQDHDGVRVSSFDGRYHTEQSDGISRRSRGDPFPLNSSKQLEGGCDLTARFSLGW